MSALLLDADVTTSERAFGALRSAAPAPAPAPAPQRERPRARLVAVPSPAAVPETTGPAQQVPPTLGSRVRVLRATDPPPVTDEADEPRGRVPDADPKAMTCAIAQAAVETLTGTRPVAQLARWLTPALLEALGGRASLSRRVLDGAGHASARPGTIAVAPVRPRRAATVRRVRIWPVDDHCVEASVVVHDGHRVRAVAVRLEAHRAAWRATALEIA